MLCNSKERQELMSCGGIMCGDRNAAMDRAAHPFLLATEGEFDDFLSIALRVKDTECRCDSCF